MKPKDKARLLGLATLAAGLLAADAAGAWYGASWNRPYGSGAMTYDRQSMMRGHGYTMRSLAAMLDGRRSFDRDEAIHLASELRDGLGERLLNRYAPGTLVAGSRTAPWTWNHFGAFEAYARGAGQAADELATALAEAPDSGPQAAGTVVPRQPYGPGRWAGRHRDVIPPAVFQAYGRLNATCHACHGQFRGPRW